jgi:hypothetical protein
LAGDCGPWRNAGAAPSSVDRQYASAAAAETASAKNSRSVQKVLAFARSRGYDLNERLNNTGFGLLVFAQILRKILIQKISRRR